MKIQKLYKNRCKSKIFLLITALSTSGCSTISYTEPSSGPVARVRFVTDTESITLVRFFADINCNGESEMMRLRNGFLFNSSPKHLEIPLWSYHENAAKEFYVPANIPQIYMFTSDETQFNYLYRCGVALSHTFEEGNDYELSYKWDNQKCKVEVSEIKQKTSGDVEKVLLYTKDNKLNSDFTKSCLDAFKGKSLWSLLDLN